MIPTKFHPIETRALGVTPSYVPRWAASIPGGHFLANEIDFIRNDFDGHAAHCTACADLQHQLGTEWPSNFVVRIQGPDFCAGAVFDLDPPICIEAAPRLAFLAGRGYAKCRDLARRQGWTIEVLEPQTQARLAMPTDP